MKFSIVVPSFNQAAFLPACLTSVLSQKGVDLEVLVFDGGSTDGSRKIIARQASHLAYWQSQPDDGQAAVLRQGFERATGDVFGWVNSDDILLPGALARVKDWLEEHPDTPTVYGDAIWIDAEGKATRARREIPFDWPIFAFGYCYLPQTSTFFRRKAYEAVGGIDPEFQTCMDYDLWHRLAKLGTTEHLPVFLAGLRDHPGTKTRRLGPVFRLEEDRLRVRYLECGRFAFALRHAWHRLRRVVLRLAHGCYRTLTPEEAEACSLTLR